MFTTGSKWFLGTGRRVVRARGRLRLDAPAATGSARSPAGYKGGVGDHLGYTLLVSIGVLGHASSGIVAVATRDAEAAALAELAGTETAPAGGRPRPRRLLAGRRCLRRRPRRARPGDQQRAVRRRALRARWPCSSSGWSWPGPTGPPATRRPTGSCATASWPPSRCPLAGFLDRRRRASLAFSRAPAHAPRSSARSSSPSSSAWSILAIGVLFATRPKLSAERDRRRPRRRGASASSPPASWRRPGASARSSTTRSRASTKRASTGLDALRRREGTSERATTTTVAEGEG